MASSKGVSSGTIRKPRHSKIRRSELNRLVEMLLASDASLLRFGQALAKHPMLLRQIIRAANSSLTGSTVEITDPAHAVLFLGTRHVTFLLNTLAPGIIDEDLEPNADSIVTEA